MKNSLLVIVMVVISIMGTGLNAIDKIANDKLPKTCIAVPRGTWWPNNHKNMLKLEAKNMKIMFLGDSICAGWRLKEGKNVWNKFYKDLSGGNYSISGDRTENVLWRITDSNDLKGTNPKVIVLLIGVNNLIQKDSPEDTAAGIKMIVSVLRKKLPQTKILLLGIFPCWGKAHPIRKKVKVVNSIISKLNKYKNITYLDIGNIFVEKDGSISKKILRDTLHPAEKGYQRWAEAMQPTLKKLLDDN